MPHHAPLIATIVAGIVLAFVLGTVANRLRLSPLVGYLVAGVSIGPFTPGYIADQALAPQLAEIGVILLMFGVGLHFSLPELLAVRTIALPGALGQIVSVSGLGVAMTSSLGWSIGAGIVFGLALSVASTAVVLHALQQKRLVDTDRGRIAVGWLVVQDLVAALALVLLPAFSGLLGGKPVEQAALQGVPAWVDSESIWASLALTLLKFAAFVAILLLIGRRVIPWILHYIAHTGSRELFRLAVLAIALGVAFGSARLFGVSFALGAFFAGMVLAESALSQRAANEVIPLRDAFAVLFFVSVGMLFNPTIVMRAPLTVGATFLIIVAGNALAVFAIILLFRHPLRAAITLGVSLSQIAEFSFILTDLGVDLKLLPEDGRDLILAGALLSVFVNPLLFAGVDRIDPWLKQREQRNAAGKISVSITKSSEAEIPATSLIRHAVLVGYGRVGRLVGESLIGTGLPILVIEERQEVVNELRAKGIKAISGNAGQPGLLKAANLAKARWLISAIPNPFESANLIEQGRADNPRLEIIARAHSDAEVEYLKKCGANFIIVGETEIARGITEHIVGRLGPAGNDALR
jgi:monovalent cation:H+ antiporter-2, CPA2 family